MKLAEFLRKVLEGDKVAVKIWEDTLKEKLPEYPPENYEEYDAMPIYEEALRRYENALQGTSG